MAPLTLTLGQIIRLLAIAAGAFVVIAAVYSFWKFEQLSRAARTRSDQPMDIRTGFLLRIAERLGIGRARSGSFCVVLAEASEAAGGPPVSAERLMAAVKPLIRSDIDEMVDLDAHRVGLLIECEPPVLPRLCERWSQAARLALRAGAASCPASATVSEDLLILAEEAFQAAPAPLAGGIALAFSPEEALHAADEDEDESPGDARVVDPLTGVLRSQRTGTAALKFMARWRREGRPVALVLLKFDDLATVAERYGADSRDESLRNLGRVLSVSVREEDLIGRLDEDEFLILAALRQGDGLPIARRVLDRFSRLAARRGAAPVRGTISAGVATAPGDAREFVDVLKCARTALLRGQRTGRGRCTRYTAAMAAERRRLDATPQDRF